MQKETYDLFVDGYINGNWSRGWTKREYGDIVKYAFNASIGADSYMSVWVNATEKSISFNFKKGERVLDFDNADITISDKYIKFDELNNEADIFFADLDGKKLDRKTGRTFTINVISSKDPEVVDTGKH